jgi:hypothetical protein
MAIVLGSCSPRGFSVVLGSLLVFDFSLLVFDFLHLVGLMAIVLGSCSPRGCSVVLGSLLVFDFFFFFPLLKAN